MNNNTFVATVRDISIEGYGVLDDPSGGVLFCMGTFPGDVGRFEVHKKRGRYGFARLHELLEPSPDRISPPCPHSGVGPGLCGGCPWMALDYSKQLKLKQKILLHNLLRLKLVDENFEVSAVTASPKIFDFRNRAQFKTNGQKIGFVSRFAQELAPIDQCLILNSQMKSLLNHLKAQLPNSEWIPSSRHKWCYLEVDDQMEFAQIKVNTKAPFRQGNSEQNQYMKRWFSNQIKDLNREFNILELFCGSGNFTQILSDLEFKNIHAVDIASDGLAALKAKALNNVNLIEANLFAPSDWKKIKAKIKFPDVILLDPPRDGFEKLSIFCEQFGQPRLIFYISCSLETFAKDSWLLKKKGYRLQSLESVDQFPHTPYIEILSVFTRT